MPKVVAIIQARMGSQRLPGKTLMKIGEREVLKHVVNRVRRTKADQVIVATTIEKEDDKIVTFCENHDIDYYRGSSGDVLQRFVETGEKTKADIVVRVCADCPFIDWRGIDKLIDYHIKTKADYTSNFGTYIKGTEAEVINFSVLKEINKKDLTSHQREHVTLYIKENKDYTKKILHGHLIHSVPLTLDYQRDYIFLNKLYELIKDE